MYTPNKLKPSHQTTKIVSYLTDKKTGKHHSLQSRLSKESNHRNKQDQPLGNNSHTDFLEQCLMNKRTSARKGGAVGSETVALMFTVTVGTGRQATTPLQGALPQSQDQCPFPARQGRHKHIVFYVCVDHGQSKREIRVSCPSLRT
eukprot:scaffold101846_cov16-Tisochrysis_lutea.AAC.1